VTSLALALLLAAAARGLRPPAPAFEVGGNVALNEDGSSRCVDLTNRGAPRAA
jgi:hypothetical protein